MLGAYLSAGPGPRGLPLDLGWGAATRNTSADTWAVRTLGPTGWRLGVAPSASASHVCSLAQPLNNPLQRQPQSRFIDEDTEAQRGPETWPRSHSRLGAEPRLPAATFPEILSNREPVSGPECGRPTGRAA